MQRLRAALVDLEAKIAKIATLQAFSELNIALNAEGREQHNKRQNIKWHFGLKDDPSLIVVTGDASEAGGTRREKLSF